MGTYEIGVSTSTSSPSNATTGDFSLVGGATKRAQTGWLVIGIVAVAGLALWLLIRR